MDDLKDQSAVSTTATNGVVESEEVRAQEALLGDTDPSLTLSLIHISEPTRPY